MGVRITAICLLLMLLGMAGCASPNQENIRLRKEIQALKEQINNLNRQHAADGATIETLQSQATTMPILPEWRVDELYTVHGLRLGRLTGGAHDPGQSGDSMLKVYAIPSDDDGDDLKAAGSFTVELFDLALPVQQRIGKWDFDIAQSRPHWMGHGLMYEYVLPCPWQTPPTHAKLLVRVKFVDGLTHRSFSVDREIEVVLPQPPTRP